MGRRKSPLLSAFFKMTRAGMRQSARIGKAATGNRPAILTDLQHDLAVYLHFTVVQPLYIIHVCAIFEPLGVHNAVCITALTAVLIKSRLDLH